jgi:hypothetical protein
MELDPGRRLPGYPAGNERAWTGPLTHALVLTEENRVDRILAVDQGQFAVDYGKFMVIAKVGAGRQDREQPDRHGCRQTSYRTPDSSRSNCGKSPR